MTYSNTNIAFIGLGTMGFAIATNLYRTGYSLSVWNRSRDRASTLLKEFSEFKAIDHQVKNNDQVVRISETLVDTVLGADIIFYSLANDEAIEEVVFSSTGLLSFAVEGQLFINLSTVHPDMSRREANAYQKKGAAYLDSPVFGSLPEAQAADLCLVIGGKQKDFERAKPILEAISSSRFHMGGTGQGASMGLIGSLMVCLQLQALGEGLTLAQKAGLDVKTVVEILGLPDFRSPIFTVMGEKIIQREFDPIFSLEHLYKDAKQILQLAKQLSVAVPGCAVAHEVIKNPVSHGWGNENASAMIKSLEQQSKTKIKQI